MLDVHGGQHGDAGVEQLLDVLPALGVAGAGHVGVRQLVDDGDLRTACEHRVDIHLGKGGLPIGQRPAGHHLQAFQQRGGVFPAVGLHEPDHDVGEPALAAVGLLQHREGLPDTGGGAEVDPEYGRVP